MMDTYTATLFCGNCGGCEEVEIPKGVARLEYPGSCTNCGRPRPVLNPPSHKANRTVRAKHRFVSVGGVLWRN